MLNAYDYIITYKPGDKHANADSLSYLPLPDVLHVTPTPADIILLIETLQATPLTVKHICHKDPLLSKVKNLVTQGWRNGGDLFNRRSRELSVQAGCILWGTV